MDSHLQSSIVAENDQRRAFQWAQVPFGFLLHVEGEIAYGMDFINSGQQPIVYQLTGK